MKNLTDHKRTVIALASVVVCLLGIGGLALAAGSGSSPTAMSSQSPPQAVSQSIAAEIGVFDRAKTPADALPASIEGSSNRWLPEQRFGANGSLARHAQNAPQGGSVFLIPSANGVCMLNTSGTENLCATSEEVQLGEAMSSIMCAPSSLPTNEIELGGILPDGVTNTEFVFSDGQRMPLTLEGNTYVADFPRSGPLPAQVEWDSADGARHSVDSHVPADVATEHCVAPAS